MSEQLQTTIRTTGRFRSTVRSGGQVSTNVHVGRKRIRSSLIQRGLKGADGSDFFGFGWISIRDGEHSETEPQEINGGDRTQIWIDGEHPAPESRLIEPFATHSLWVDNALQTRAVDDGLLVRLTFTGRSIVQNNDLSIELDIGNAENGPVVIQSDQGVFPFSAGETRDFTINYIIYQLDTFAQNGGRFFITTNGDAEVWNASLLLMPLTTNGRA